MTFPVKDFETQWNLTAGLGFGVKTEYGFHEANDINLNGGGNSDLGQPLFAVADGEISSVHTHTGSPTFGKHLHLKFNIDGKDYWAHYAHCNEILVTEGTKVKKGDKIATCGNSGTTFAHLHFAIKNQPTGVDGLAKTSEDLKKWENPIEFIKKHFVVEEMVTLPQKELDEIRIARDNNWKLAEERQKTIDGLRVDLQKEQENSKTYLKQLEKISEEEKSTTEQLISCEKKNQPLQDALSATKKTLGYDDTLLTEKLADEVQKLKDSKVIYKDPPTGFIEKILFLIGRR